MLTEAAFKFMSSEQRDCAPFEPTPISRSRAAARSLFPMHWRRAILRWFANAFDVQCSGKQLEGFGNTYCQHRAGHEGTCHDFNGRAFRSTAL